jgi:hypothetical protein
VRAIEAGLAEKSKEFLAGGAQLYAAGAERPEQP